MASHKQSSFSFAATVAAEQRLVLARQLDRLSMWKCGLGAGPLKPEHELTENAMDETWEEEEEMEEEESIIETVELPGSGVNMTPEMVLEAGQLSRAEQNLIEQC